MANIGHFDADTVDTNITTDPVPPGKYLLAITASDVKQVKGKADKYIHLEHTVLDGQYSGRKVFNNLNMWNSNPQATKIAEAHFACLCKAVGKRQVRDTAELHSIPFYAEIEVEAGKDGNRPQNRIKKYLFEDDHKAPKTTVGVQPSTSAGVPWGNG